MRDGNGSLFLIPLDTTVSDKRKYTLGCIYLTKFVPYQ